MKTFTTGLGSLLLLLGACGEQPPTHEQPTQKLPVPSAARRPVRAPAPRYAGTYAVTDSAVCALSITITRQGKGYRFRTGEAQGAVRIAPEGADATFTLVGLKGAYPDEDISLVWADSALLIQNYGNSMNPYLRFDQCDDKYLTLWRQQP